MVTGQEVPSSSVVSLAGKLGLVTYMQLSVTVPPHASINKKLHSHYMVSK